MQLLADFKGLPWIASHAWLYPALEVVHIVGIALLFGSLVLVELRVFGFGAELALPALARFGLRLTLVGFGIALSSGSLLFLSQPAELLASPAFIVKMALLVAAGVNAAVFHASGALRRGGLRARLQTTLSLGLWLAIIICGRWIAYD
jgi:hypothetical protein